MKQSPSITELAKALIKTQLELKKAKRTQVNPFYKSKYADLAEIWEACREPLNKNALAICQTIDTEGEKTYLETMLLHESGEWISGRLPLLLTKLDPQGQGSAITYARRYSLTAIIGMAEVDDDAEATTEHPETEPKQSHWCSIHKAVFFKKGKMKNYAHVIEGTDEWCNEGEPSTQPSPLVRAAVEMGGVVVKDTAVAVENTTKDKEFKNAGDFLMQVFDECGYTKTKTLKLLGNKKSIQEVTDLTGAWVFLKTLKEEEDEEIASKKIKQEASKA